MQEILTAVTYLVAWLACEKVFHIESGLIKLILSLGAAVGVYVLIAVKESREKKRKKEED
jgi:Na+-translocating ferredoxin:NAD+ oxidoreductase RnfE subunit